MKIDLSCAMCGGSLFIYPVRFSGSSVINCASCGHDVGTVAEVQQKFMEELERHNADPEARKP